jgi:hypothetical protein
MLRQYKKRVTHGHAEPPLAKPCESRISRLEEHIVMEFQQIV